MFEPWCQPWIFITAYGSFVGGVGGTALGVAGGVGGDLARKGHQRAWVGVTLKAVFVFGILSLIGGVIAIGLRQPFGIWATLVTFGGGLSWLARGIDRGVRKMYEESIQRSKLILPDDERNN